MDFQCFKGGTLVSRGTKKKKQDREKKHGQTSGQNQNIWRLTVRVQQEEEKQDQSVSPGTKHHPGSTLHPQNTKFLNI